MGKGSGRRPAQISQAELQDNYDRTFRHPQAESPPVVHEWPRCADCKVRHDPAVDCQDVTY